MTDVKHVPTRSGQTISHWDGEQLHTAKFPATDVDAIVVTQADRDRAAVLLGGAAPDGLLEGRADSLSVVQAFATHRTETTAALEARVRELEGELQLAVDHTLNNG